MKKKNTRKPKRKVVKMSMESKRIAEILESTPDVRKDKIAAIKKAVHDGSYRIKSEYIARKMVEELVLEINR
jgi:flagellar biosynthesis anti-sigma factor FlgM